jgi:2,3-bisphosphoglycerate-independent phosphoglycerate mutase
MSKKSLLIIMDGWGHGKKRESDAIQNAHIPYIQSLYTQYPHSELITCGEVVGLPKGQMGNSEVGHLNIGAGRIVYQELQRINKAIEEGEFKRNPVFQKLIHDVQQNNKTLHLIGLLSDGGVHAHSKHIMAICDYCEEANLENVCLHVFTDGRDTDPKSGYGFLEELQNHIHHKKGIRIASVIGRFYAMDRDKRWERVKIAYDAMVFGKGNASKNLVQSIEESYANGITDEFIQPIIAVDQINLPIGKIQDGDAVLSFNFRTDRCREITLALSQVDFPEQKMKHLDLQYVTMTEYDKSFKNVQSIFQQDDLQNTIGEVIAKHGRKQIRIAETEKYPHVSFFFSGGRETPFEGERRILIPSTKEVATYDLKPEMSAHEITDAILTELNIGEVDFICLNFANTDMVGHTGVWEAAIKAAETVNDCVAKIIPIALVNNYTVFLTADHGNSDYLINEDGTPNTAHTLNPVPFFVIDKNFNGQLRNGKLADIAPTILHWMGLPIPKEMSGDILLV